jgi:hypothetical protein
MHGRAGLPHKGVSMLVEGIKYTFPMNHQRTGLRHNHGEVVTRCPILVN